MCLELKIKMYTFLSKVCLSISNIEPPNYFTLPTKFLYGILNIVINIFGNRQSNITGSNKNIE